MWRRFELRAAAAAPLFQVGFNGRIGDLSQFVTRRAFNLRALGAATQERDRHYRNEQHNISQIYHLLYLNKFA